MARLLLAAVLAAPVAAYVAPTPGAGLPQPKSVSAAVVPDELLRFEAPAEAESSSPFGVLAAGLSIGAVMGWLNARKQQAASVAAATAVAVTPLAASAYVDYENIEYLGGSDKVDINNANIQAYRQFPGMFPTAAAAIATHGPFKSVKEIYDIPNLDPRVVDVFKKYEANLVCLPANPAYFIDRINNGLYR
eukprot:TRINITY_DN1687_c0_g1_i1.p1 TRINITY_DN1687_c0_g1~~TRINITY_DN1687_c0_g1_i1.p1  ORF type:complete len:191 (-),score=64.44 TRINITY_DN1687_c0_g1_i1:74-646(-)